MALGALAVLALSGAPAEAGAATVSVASTRQFPYIADFARFVAAPGERNVVTVTAVIDGAAPSGVFWDFTDTGATIEAGPGCASLSPHSARCSPTTYEATVELGDLDDEMTFTSRVSSASGIVFPYLEADGGPGNDLLSGPSTWPHVLRGGAGDDELFAGTRRHGNDLDGGPGDDLLVGGNGGDRLAGGGGRDRILGSGGDDHLSDGDLDGAGADARPGPDVLDGGQGIDEVSYATRRRPVVVDLSGAAPDGEEAESDTLTSIESVVGGSAPDVLIGDDARNILDGRGGRDRVAGGGGNDLLRPGGDDLSCGDGRDVVGPLRPSRVVPPPPEPQNVGARDHLAPDCESIRYWTGLYHSELIAAQPRTADRRSIGYPVHCLGAVSCSGTISLRRPAPRRGALARGTFRPGQRLAKARLSTLGRRLASRRSGVEATVRITGLVRWDPTRALRWSIRLEIPAG